MGQGSSRDYQEAEYRLEQIGQMAAATVWEAQRLLPLAEAEKAAGIPPTPGSSQAAHKAALDYYLVLADEQSCIWRRQSRWRRRQIDGLRPACLSAECRQGVRCQCPGLRHAARYRLMTSTHACMVNISHSCPHPLYHVPLTCGAARAGALRQGLPNPPPMPPPTPPPPPKGALGCRWADICFTEPAVAPAGQPTFLPACQPAHSPACPACERHMHARPGLRRAFHLALASCLPFWHPNRCRRG